MNQGKAETVRVTIFGEDYTIRSPMGAEYTRRCAAHVDAAINEAHVRGHVAEPHKAAILAAMQITDQLFRSRAELDEQTHIVGRRIEALREAVEETLAS